VKDGQKYIHKYTVHELLIFSWSDTCWERRIWRVDTFRFCYGYGERKLWLSDTNYNNDPHSRVHHTLSGSDLPHWHCDWSRHQCVTTTQIHTDNSPLLASHLHCIGQLDSSMCPYCDGTEEMAEHLIMQCSTHVQIRQEMWPNLQLSSDQRRLWGRSGQWLASLIGNDRSSCYCNTSCVSITMTQPAIKKVCLLYLQQQSFFQFSFTPS